MWSPMLMFPDALTVRFSSTTPPDGGGSGGGPAGVSTGGGKAGQVAGIEPGGQGLDPVPVQQHVHPVQASPQPDCAAGQRWSEPDLLPSRPQLPPRWRRRHDPPGAARAGTAPSSRRSSMRPGNITRKGAVASPVMTSGHPCA
jgi:hypothetical protein